ncbi:hypothetical protein TELCIR_07173 [Teladorsagia circumcincta]|uniref:GPAT/DHAPAT C-terminal domain-containing protein n=1 Tax=Teladorsagia circumcincta TaxID=45464 RepID=A0A2G9UMI3_TELCI|nr:hypothetical protein TELCIR_07173 [Teladorsagia circumcincta]
MLGAVPLVYYCALRYSPTSYGRGQPQPSPISLLSRLLGCLLRVCAQPVAARSTRQRGVMLPVIKEEAPLRLAIERGILITSKLFCCFLTVRKRRACGVSDEQAQTKMALYYVQSIGKSIDRHIDTDSDEDCIYPIITHRQLVNLAYNKNALVPLFALRSAIGLSMISRQAGQHLFEEIVEDVALICDWMQFEVIFCKPCEDLKAVIAVALGRSGVSHVQHGELSMHGDEEDLYVGGDAPQLQCDGFFPVSAARSTFVICSISAMFKKPASVEKYCIGRSIA